MLTARVLVQEGISSVMSDGIVNCLIIANLTWPLMSLGRLICDWLIRPGALALIPLAFPDASGRNTLRSLLSK